jgi:hypothetical protein
MSVDKLLSDIPHPHDPCRELKLTHVEAKAQEWFDIHALISYEELIQVRNRISEVRRYDGSCYC